VVADLVYWIDSARRRGLSLEAIKELVPLWRFLHKAFKAKNVDLAEFEYMARQFIRTPEAAYAVPSLFFDRMPCPVHEEDQLRSTRFVLKDGREIDASTEPFVPLSFAIAQQDEDGNVQLLATSQLALPLTYDGDATAIVLGVPNGVEVPLHGHRELIDLGTRNRGEIEQDT
jgi:hypothetical protein